MVRFQIQWESRAEEIWNEGEIGKSLESDFKDFELRTRKMELLFLGNIVGTGNSRG